MVQVWRARDNVSLLSVMKFTRMLVSRAARRRWVSAKCDKNADMLKKNNDLPFTSAATVENYFRWDMYSHARAHTHKRHNFKYIEFSPNVYTYLTKSSEKCRLLRVYILNKLEKFLRKNVFEKFFSMYSPDCTARREVRKWNYKIYDEEV